jgi:hypothetical protein
MSSSVAAAFAVLFHETLQISTKKRASGQDARFVAKSAVSQIKAEP